MLKFNWIGGWVLAANDAWACASMPLRLDIEPADHQQVNLQAAVQRMEAQHHGQ